MSDFLTRDPAFASLIDLVDRAARSASAILITGESGTGKNRLARRVHERSPRAQAPFVEVPCANLPPDLAEADLFGHDRGAFTDAHADRTGRLERAHGGTLFLDEVQELDPGVQAKLLRAIEQKRFERLGGNETREVDVRIVSSMREEPERLVAAGRLRDDLFYRLNVVRVDLPPLRQRCGDVPLLAEAFLAEARRRHSLVEKKFDAEALAVLTRYPWPGNVRELAHAVESAAVLAAGERIGSGDLPTHLSVVSPAMLRAAASSGVSLEALEAAYIDEVLRRTQGNKTAAARILGIHRKTLHEKLRGRADGTS